ncbi:hypothetical protein DPV78_002062, partial [Talaromyces pinophilus]
KQATALLWVQKYISGLGGDPDRVALIGESAGAGTFSNATILDGHYSRFSLNDSSPSVGNTFIPTCNANGGELIS